MEQERDTQDTQPEPVTDPEVITLQIDDCEIGSTSDDKE